MSEQKTTAPKAKAPTPIKEESIAIIEFMQEAGTSLFDIEIGEGVDQAVTSVRPRLNALVKRGLVAKEDEKSPRTVTDTKTGKPVERMYVKYYLTDEGNSFAR